MYNQVNHDHPGHLFHLAHPFHLGRPVVGYDRLGRQVVGYDRLGHPVVGYNRLGHPVVGYDRLGHQDLLDNDGDYRTEAASDGDTSPTNRGYDIHHTRPIHMGCTTSPARTIPYTNCMARGRDWGNSLAEQLSEAYNCSYHGQPESYG
ncbi:hypothetical protein [Dictyobacter halimunensis]|uniref:hypothetical protein n=1 Tax=Dictyobacter halimunensis TaxID=3026934 RepID=UPI0030C6A7CE